MPRGVKSWLIRTEGEKVVVRLAGRRPFEAVVLVVREGGTMVDVADPRNGGRRTVLVEQTRRPRVLKNKVA